MRSDVFHEAGKYTEKHRKKRRWYRISASLAAVVVFCTVYLLMMPAVTLERQSDLLEDAQTEACQTAEEYEAEEAADPEVGENPAPEEAPEGETPNPEEAPEGETPNPEEAPEGETPNLEKAPEGETPNPEEAPEGETPNPEETQEKGEIQNPKEETLTPEQTENPELSENGELPASPELLQEATTETEEEEFVLTACTESGIKVTVTGMSTALPCPAEEITVTAEEKDTETEEDQLFPDPMEEEQESELIGKYLLDITLKHGEEEIEPTGPVKVTFSGLQVEGCDPKIYHIDTEEQEVTDMEVDREENGDMTITTDHFSLYQIELRAPEAVAETPSETSLSGYIGDKLKDGGTFVLNGDACTAQDGSQANLTIEKNTTIDLKGHTLTISQPNQQFEIQTGATLTILDSATKDSASANETVTTESTSSKLYGNASTLDEDQLTYYITRSKPKDDETGTKETLEKHVLGLTNTGIIENSEQAGGDNQIFLVKNGGTLNLEGGVLRNKADKKRVVCVSGGAFHMSGGYIVGGTHPYGGGGVYTSAGTMTMTGGVIAANQSNFGGGIYAGGGTLNLSGGVVTGNQVGGHGNGGGIYVTNATLNLSGDAYVTNNILPKCDCPETDVNNKHGGGGITIGDNSQMEMSGGYVTGNDAWLSGGGIYAGFWNHRVGFTMRGGTIARNHVQIGEGGGLRIAGGTNGGTNGVIMADPNNNNNKIYITNNKTETPDDWGGGGIFIQENGTLNITNALITENSAGGFGGGIGVCPTGKTLIVHADGGAVYSNRAEGTNMSDGGNGKHYDTSVAKASEIFKTNGYADFFCVRSRDGANNEVSLVTGEMLGDGAANWKGSCDEQKVEISKSGYAAAKYLFGLTSHPEKDAITEAKKAAKVIISGNHSNIHGGGIMTNGGLILGTIENAIVSETPSLTISGTKVLLKDEEEQSSGLNFKFQLTDATGTVVGEAFSNATTGEFTISPNEKYTHDGTYVYHLSEVQDNRDGVEYDKTKYKIEVQITKNTTNLLGVNFVSYEVGSATVTKEGDSSSQNLATGKLNADGSYSLQFDNTAFTNTMTTPLKLKLVKTDKDKPETLLPGAKFTLKKEGSGTTMSEETTDGNGEATFSNIEKNSIYYLYETEPPTGYRTAGPWILEIKDDNTGVYYPAKKNEDGTLVKTEDGKLVKTEDAGTAFQVTSGDTIVLEMKISDQSWGYKLPDTGGLGTTGYRTGGLALVVSALAWKYILTKRRKEDEISS